MTRDDQHQAAARLDQQWDELVRGRSAESTDPLLRHLHAHGPGEPSPLFVGQLRSLIEVAAQDMPGRRVAAVAMTAPALTVADEPRLLPRPVPARRQPGRMRGLSYAGAIASAAMAAALLIAMLAAVVRYPFGGSDDPVTPSTASQGTSIAAPGSSVETDGEVAVSSADPGRTGVQPGPGPLGIPQIVGQVDVVGSAMALSDGLIVVVDRDRLTAFDSDNLETVWSVELRYGLYTAPAIAGGAIFLGYTEQREGITEYMLGADHNNQLVSISLADGSENWRIDGAGAFPVAPLVADGIVYAVGSSPDAYHLNAIEPGSGSTLWTAEPFIGPDMPEDVRPQSPPYLDMTLAYGDGKIAVNQLYELTVYDSVTGDELWSQTATGEEIVGKPVIQQDFVVVTNSFHAWQVGQTGSGRITAFDLQSGEQRWSNDSLSGNVADVVVQGSVFFGGAWAGAENPVLASLAMESGEAGWVNPFWDATSDPTLDYWWIPDTSAIVDDLVYTVSQAAVQGDQRRSLISATHVESGEVSWTVIIDGTVLAEPIIAGGNVYLLTDLYGIQVLGDNPDASVTTPESGVADLRAALVCDMEPIDNPLAGGPITGDTPPPPFDQWGAPIASDDVPVFDPADAVSDEIAETITHRFGEFLECSQIGDTRTQFGFFSSDYYQRLSDLGAGTLDGEDGESGTMAVFFASTGERVELDVTTLQVLPDGRIGGYVDGQVDIYVWFVLEGGKYQIDEFHRITGAEIQAEESPGP